MKNWISKVVTKHLKSWLIVITWGLFSQSLFAQEQLLKDFAEGNYDRKFCFYPSTIRMINLNNDQEFNEMVKPIDKLLIYMLDSVTTAGGAYNETITAYEKNGFEEYARIFGNGYNVQILGKETPDYEWVGLFKMDQQAFTFYLVGNVNWQKLPKMMQTLEDNNLLNIMDLNFNNKERNGRKGN